MCYGLFGHTSHLFLRQSPRSYTYGIWGRGRIVEKSGGLIFLMHPLASTLKEISIEDLVEYVNTNYSQATARIYLSVLKQVKLYGGGIYHLSISTKTMLVVSGDFWPSGYLRRAYRNICAVCVRCSILISDRNIVHKSRGRLPDFPQLMRLIPDALPPMNC